MRISAVIFCLLLSACSAPSVQIHYYQLYPGMPDNYPSQGSQHAVVLQHVELADYLQKPALVMRTREGVLYYAKTHMWGSTLKQDVSLALLDGLNVAAGEVMYMQASHNAEQSLRVRIEQMLPTEDGRVLIQASVWFSQGTQQLWHQRMSFTHEIQGQGYLAAVEGMRGGLNNLALQIHQRVSASR